MSLDLIRQLDAGDAIRRLTLITHRQEGAPAGGALPLIGWQLMPNLHDRQCRVLTRTVSWLRATRRARRRCRLAVLRLKDRGPGLVQIVLHREGQLLDVRDPAQARELRCQLQVLRNEALIFAIEKETDLAKRVDIVFFAELHHSGVHLIIARDRMQAKNRSVRVV